MAVLHTYAWVKLLAYAACVGVALELAHRVYWRLLRSSADLGSAFGRYVSAAALPAIPFGVTIGITSLFSEHLDHRPLAAIGLYWDDASLPCLAYGTAISAICVMIVFILGHAGQVVQTRPSSFWKSPGERMPKFLSCLMDFVFGSAFEEIIMRGYIFALLYSVGGAFEAVIGSSVIFSAFHLIKHPKLPAIYTANAFAFGLLAGYARLITGGLWLPIGLHLGWNVTMGPVFGLPCSGKNYENGLLCSSVRGPAWVSGGLYSPDAGILGTAGLMVAAAGFAMIRPM